MSQLTDIEIQEINRQIAAGTYQSEPEQEREQTAEQDADDVGEDA